jgi:DNA-binding transcriptional MerR regulator/methylmalonyl-CoA mutase cobalamin-binding subunit
MPGLNIAAMTKRTGVPADTIRKWEQRYGVLQPERTPGGQRRYSELDVARVEWLKARLREGYRIGEAAALLGSGDVIPLTPTALRDELVAATSRNDIATLEKLVDQALALPSVDVAFFEVITPALVEVGERWSAGDVGVAQEHLCTAVVRAGLQRLLSDTRPGVRGTAVLACAPGEQHEIGLLMLAVLLRADGWQVAYLGPNTPTGDTLSLATALAATVVCFSVGTAEHSRALNRTLSGANVPERLEVVVGGRGVDQLDLRKTVAALRKRAA